MEYVVDIAGVKRTLPLCKIGGGLCFAAFIMFGDVEITEHSARELLKRVPEFDIIVTAESKGIPLAYEMARQAGMNNYIVARKAAKLYMSDVTEVNVKSISTDHYQTLCVGADDAEAIKGRRVLIADDVISTGESLNALEALVNEMGGKVVGKAAVLAEGDAIGRSDITYLAPLPLFFEDGTIKE